MAGQPLTFAVPYNGSARGPALEYLVGQRDCEIVRCGSPIRASMAALLDGISDTTWVYWCIDDRFPTWLDRSALAAVHAQLAALPPACEEVKLLRWYEPVAPATQTVGDVAFATQRRHRHWGFWHHHFVRAGVLRRVFFDPAVADDAAIQDVISNRLLGRGRRRHLPGRVESRLFPGAALVPTAPLIRLAEPVMQGRLTRNGLAALRGHGCEIPPYDVSDTEKEYLWAEP